MSKNNGYRLFKTSYTDRKGKAREAAKWYVEFRDHLETVRRLPAFASKAASDEFGRNVVKLVAYYKATGGQTDPALTRWLAGLPQQTKEKLVGIGLIERERAGAGKTLAEHLADFGAALLAKGNSAFHAELVPMRARKITEGCAFKFYADIKPSKVMAFLTELRKDTETKRGISAQTFNFYLSAIKQFCKWMVKDRRAMESPVAHLDGLNVKTDRRRDRRALTVDELLALLDATHNGPVRSKMTGPRRALLYRLAVETGLRSGELRSLERHSFDLDGQTVTVDAEYSKHRRQDTLPLRPELAEALREFLAALPADEKPFPIPRDRKDAAGMFRADLEAAGLAYRDEDGRVADFHSLRHTAKLPPHAAIPAWATSGAFFSITRTADELSIVCDESQVPPGVQAERGWRCLRVAGKMEFSMVGVLASLVGPLAQAGISVFAISTFDTDYLLVKDGAWEQAREVLRQAGHSVG